MTTQVKKSKNKAVRQLPAGKQDDLTALCLRVAYQLRKLLYRHLLRDSTNWVFVAQAAIELEMGELHKGTTGCIVATLVSFTESILTFANGDPFVEDEEKSLEHARIRELGKCAGVCVILVPLLQDLEKLAVAESVFYGDQAHEIVMTQRATAQAHVHDVQTITVGRLTVDYPERKT